MTDHELLSRYLSRTLVEMEREWAFFICDPRTGETAPLATCETAAVLDLHASAARMGVPIDRALATGAWVPRT